MKKLFILAAMMTATLAANAQYTPEAGKISTEVSFNPFTQDGPQLPTANGVKVRYFFADNQALRVNLAFGLNSNKNGEATETTAKTTNKKTNFGIGLGYENHFAQFDRLSVYGGAGVDFAMQSTNKKVETTGATEETKNADGYTKFGVKAFTGVDVYLWKGLFVGAELGFQFANTSYKDPEYKTATSTVKANNKQSATELGFYIEPALRLGWTF
jgi:opacity protein-like surface antigen